MPIGGAISCDNLTPEMGKPEAPSTEIWRAGVGSECQRVIAWLMPACRVGPRMAKIMQKSDRVTAWKNCHVEQRASLPVGVTMFDKFFSLLKVIVIGPLVAFTFLAMPASASPISFDLVFSGCIALDLKSGCTGTDTIAGGGTITFPELTGDFGIVPPSPGVALDLTVSSLSFNQDDITSISWTISPDMSTLESLALTLDTNPDYTFPNDGGHDYASISFSQDSGGTWNAASSGCSSDGICSNNTSNLQNRTTTVSLSTVPAPPSAWLFASGLLGLAGAGGRNRGNPAFIRYRDSGAGLVC